jgi:hypothetical protein
MVADPRKPLLHVMEALSSGHGRQCFHPRDHVYGLLGLLPLQMACGIVPNYSLPVSVVYKEVFLHILRQMSRLDMSCLCDLATRQIPGQCGFQTCPPGKGIVGGLILVLTLQGSRLGNGHIVRQIH